MLDPKTLGERIAKQKPDLTTLARAIAKEASRKQGEYAEVLQQLSKASTSEYNDILTAYALRRMAELADEQESELADLFREWAKGYDLRSDE